MTYLNASKAPKRAAIALVILALAAAIAAVVWVFVLPGPAASAQGTVEEACREAGPTNDFDVRAQMTVEAVGEPDYQWEAGTLRNPMFDIRYSGRDFHLVVSTAVQGVVGEAIRVGGTVYVRDTGQPWIVEYPPDNAGIMPFSFLGTNPTCPDLGALSDYIVLSEETVDGESIRRYGRSAAAAAEGEENAPEVTEGRVSLVREFWLAADGRLVQLQNTEVYRSEYLSPRVVRTTVVVKFSTLR